MQSTDDKDRGLSKPSPPPPRPDNTLPTSPARPDNTLPEPRGRPKKEEVPINPATGKPYKAGEVPLGDNEPVGGEWLGSEKERFDCENKRAEKVAKEAEEKSEAERKRMADADAKRAKEEAKGTKVRTPD
jgi:hypothetical protein